MVRGRISVLYWYDLHLLFRGHFSDPPAVELVFHSLESTGIKAVLHKRGIVAKNFTKMAEVVQPNRRGCSTRITWIRHGIVVSNPLVILGIRLGPDDGGVFIHAERGTRGEITARARGMLGTNGGEV